MRQAEEGAIVENRESLPKKKLVMGKEIKNKEARMARAIQVEATHTNAIPGNSWSREEQQKDPGLTKSIQNSK